MRNSVLALVMFSALSLPFCDKALAESTETIEVHSSELQFDKAFVSPPRSPLLNKQLIQTDINSSNSNWQAKNQALQALPPITKHRGDITNNASTDVENTAISTNDFWIYDSWATLSNDIDYDGYYSKVTVEFDADTVYNRAYVYAIIYLGINDVFDSIHVTSVFAIDADSSNDSFVVESDLLSGFPSNDYEILIELYDADTDEFVAFSDGLDDADLSFVSLESRNYEHSPEPRVVIVNEHGGSIGLIGLFAVALLLLRRKFI